MHRLDLAMRSAPLGATCLAMFAACSAQLDGAPMPLGSDGEVAVVASVEALVPACASIPAADGVVYYDLATQEFYICSNRTLVTLDVVGKPGADGTSWLAFSSPADGGTCPAGGIMLQLGPDDNGNGLLDTSEVESASSVCNGRDGNDGADGADGSSCSVVDNGDGTKTISCTDGSSATVSDGANAVALACPNGIVQQGEECDDGNLDDADGCTNFCKLAVCGDGVVQTSRGEVCDDGNADEYDGCSDACQISVALADIEAMSSVLDAGASTEFIVSLDAPAGPEGVTITLILDPPTAGFLPTSVTVPAGMTQASFTYVDGGSAPVVQVSASLGPVTLYVVLDIVTSADVQIQEVQFDGVAAGSTVAIKKVFVTAVDSAGAVTLYVQEPEGESYGSLMYPEYAGLAVYLNAFEATLSTVPGVGECIDLIGTVDEFLGDTQLTGVTITPASDCGAPPAPFGLPLPQIASDLYPSSAGISPGAQAEAYEGVLVQVSDLQVVALGSPGEFSAAASSDPTGPIMVVDDFFVSMSIHLGQTFGHVDGIYAQDGDTYKLRPRWLTDAQ